MKKLFFLFAALLCIGSLMAQKKVIKMSTYHDAIGTEYVNTQTTYGTAPDTITLIPGTGGSGWKMQTDTTLLFGKMSAALQLPAFDFAVSKIVVNGAPSGASGKVTFNVFDGTTAVSTSATGANGAHTFMIASDHQAAGTIYTIKNTNANNNQIVSIEIYEAVAGAPENPEFSLAGKIYTSAQSVSLTCATEGASIYYTLDGTEPNANSTLYTAPISVSTTTTIKAVAIKDGIASTVVSATYTIVSVEGQGTQDNPYTIADVKALNNCGDTAVWVQGTIIGVYDKNKPQKDSTSINSNLALATSSDTIPVALPSNDVRTALNLVDHPEYLGAVVKVKGDLLSYFSTTGVKNVSAYEIISTPSFLNQVATDQKVQKFFLNGRLIILRNGLLYDATGHIIK